MQLNTIFKIMFYLSFLWVISAPTEAQETDSTIITSNLKGGSLGSGDGWGGSLLRLPLLGVSVLFS